MKVRRREGNAGRAHAHAVLEAELCEPRAIDQGDRGCPLRTRFFASAAQHLTRRNQVALGGGSVVVQRATKFRYSLASNLAAVTTHHEGRSELAARLVYHAPEVQLRTVRPG